MSEHPPVISSARMIAGCTLTSRVTGLIRDMLLVHAFGAAWALDAFFFAFQIPNLFRRLFGEGALAAVFVPTFTRTLETDGPPAAWKLLARTLALLTVVLLFIIAIVELALLLIWIFTPGGEDRQVILGLTALMLPFMLSICIVALLSSILNCVGSFVPAALTPVVLNLVMIAGIVWGGRLVGDLPEQRVFGVALSVLVAGGLQLVLLAPVLRRRGVPLGWSFRPRDPQVGGMLRLMPPVLLGQGVLLLGTFIDATICAVLTHVGSGSAATTWLGVSFDLPLREGALSAITVATRLYQFPLGVFGISLAIAALPTLSRHAARAQWSEWSEELTRSLRLALFVGLLAGGLMVVVPGPIVQLLFEYRNFDADATARAARVLMFYGLGMWAFFAQHIILRGFYSVGDVRTPVKISCVLVPVNVALSLTLIWFDSIRESAFAISTSVTSTLAAATGFVLLRQRAGAGFGGAGAAWAVARMFLATGAATTIVCWLRAVWLPHLDNAIGSVVLRRGLDTLGALGIGTGVFFAAAAALRLPEPMLLLRYGRRGAPPRPAK